MLGLVRCCLVTGGAANHDLELDGRVALVTGGGGAIGRATALALARHGAAVAVVDIDGARTEGAVEALTELGTRNLGITVDATDDGALTNAITAVTDGLGPIDILVNGVGEHLSSAARFQDTAPEQWERLHRVNLWHVFTACQAVLPGMRARRFGRIINFSSVEGIRAAPMLAVYAAYKAAIDAFTKSLAVEVAGDGINVNAIAVDKTRAHQVDFYELPPEYERHVPVWIPKGRYGEGEDVAGVVLFLASTLGQWVVGQTVVADGGTLSAGGWYRTPTRFTNSPLLVQYFEDEAATERHPPMLR